MACRPPPVHPPSPASLCVKLLHSSSLPRCVPADALLVTNDDEIFLAIIGALREPRRVLLAAKLGYVFLGEVNRKIVFVLNAAGKQQVVLGVVEFLQPRLVVCLGFCVSTAKCHSPGDLLVAEEVNCGSATRRRLKLKSSAFLTRIFLDGRFGWDTPTARGQRVHKGEILHEAMGASGFQGLLKSRGGHETVATAPSSGLGESIVYLNPFTP